MPCREANSDTEIYFVLIGKFFLVTPCKYNQFLPISASYHCNIYKRLNLMKYFPNNSQDC